MKRSASSKSKFGLIEMLEARQLMSGTPLSVTQAIVDGGLQLHVSGGNKSDNILIAPTRGGLRISNGKWSKKVGNAFNSIVVRGGKGNDRVQIDASITAPAMIYGGVGDDTLIGGSGDDKLYGQGGTDNLDGENGDDVLVNVGDSKADLATGGAGIDTFWTDAAGTEQVSDASADEIADGAVHRVDSFYGFSTVRKGAVRANRIALDLNGGDLADPGLDDPTARYANFSSNPLFSGAGPSPDDVDQGYVGDCWYLSTLSAVARVNPEAIRQAVVELGDGTYAVQFAHADGSKAFVRVDGDLPTASWGGMQYAEFGADNSIWVAIMEKAYACFRDGGVANYSDLDGGWMSEAFTDLGYSSTEIWDAADGDELFDGIARDLADGKAVTLAINQPKNNCPCVGSHAYSVVSIDTDGQGNRTMVLRNPWGIDGAGHDGVNDGYVHVTPLQAFTSYWGVISGTVN